ncbi:MAG: hypothetical protein WAW05_10105 [Corynebacterium casei]
MANAVRRRKRRREMRLFCDCKTDEEKSNFFLSGMAVETGVIAPAISNDVAMAYHRCAQFKKENDELRAKIETMEKQKPMELNYIELLKSAQKSVESYVYFRRFIASTPLENDIAIWMVDFVFAQLNAKGE